MKNNKRLQTLIINVDIVFKWFVKFVLNISAVRTNSKFLFLCAAVSNEQNSFSNSCYKINLKERRKC